MNRKLIMLSLFLKRSGWAKAEFLKKKQVFYGMGGNAIGILGKFQQNLIS